MIKISLRNTGTNYLAVLAYNNRMLFAEFSKRLVIDFRANRKRTKKYVTSKSSSVKPPAKKDIVIWNVSCCKLLYLPNKMVCIKCYDKEKNHFDSEQFDRESWLQNASCLNKSLSTCLKITITYYNNKIISKLT
jgi:hypothetical protein